MLHTLNIRNFCLSVLPEKKLDSVFTYYLCNNKMHLLLLFSHLIMTSSLWPHGLQYSSILCSPVSPRTCSNSCPSNQWCHPTVSSSVVSFSSCLQSFPSSGSFPMSQFFTSGGQSIGSFSFVIKFLILQYHHLCRKWLVFLSRIVKLIFLKHLLDQVTLQFEILQWLVCLLNET